MRGPCIGGVSTTPPRSVGTRTRIALGGDSAGGYLATAACLDAKRLGVAQPVHQLLVYPDVDMANRSESMVTIDAFVNLAMITSMHAAHAGDARLDPRVSPIHADDHTGLDPATILARRATIRSSTRAARTPRCCV